MDQVIDARSLIGAAIWRDWLAAAMASGALAHPPIGTPSAQTQGGNSAPARSLVPGLGESPVFSPVEGL
mgnify:FL=1